MILSENRPPLFRIMRPLVNAVITAIPQSKLPH